MMTMAAVLAAACNSNGLSSPGDDGGGSDGSVGGDLAGACAALDETTCGARADCHAVYGSGYPCKNIWGFCPGPYLACEDGAAQCQAGGLPACAQDEPFCAGQYVVNWHGSCPFGCVRATSCANCGSPCTPCSVLDEQSCRARRDCHALYRDPGTCDCFAPGCCMMFYACGDNAAVCDANPTCASPAPVCGGEYVTSYVSGCPDGCVNWHECPFACDSTADCGPGLTCCSSPVAGNPRKFCFQGSTCPP